ncbi:MAG TPA: HD domain-containing phosphohydrolase, partial [Geobacteraceae bacterium]|nr:HD domain-containing phosphohydrolase [Geobacteraceae bacterium]
VAYAAYNIAGHMGLPAKQRNELALAGKLHDIGALASKERAKTMQFELHNPQRHAEMGWLLLRGFEPLAGVAELIRFHHVRCDAGESGYTVSPDVMIGSHILHLADRVAVLLRKSVNPLAQKKRICRQIVAQSGGMFLPQVVNAFLKLAEKEYFWLDLCAPSLGSFLARRITLETIELDLHGLLTLSNIFAKIIDFRSPFTATHSSGVAASAAALARLAGCSERECEMMKVAGYFHDLGKLAVPPEILEKPGKLTPRQQEIVRCHPFYTYRTLERIDDLATINSWCSFHHESLDGKGYPFRLTQRSLPLGSRIMSVADVFTAITEDRPYREGMPADRAFAVLDEMVANSVLDGNVVNLLANNFDEINSIRIAAQGLTVNEYRDLQHQLVGYA